MASSSAQSSTDSKDDAPLFQEHTPAAQLEDYVKDHMARYRDPSHDYSHVKRVVTTSRVLLAGEIVACSTTNHPTTTTDVMDYVDLLALCHDLFDHKFDTTHHDSTMSMLVEFLGRDQALKLRADIERVSYTMHKAEPVDAEVSLALRVVRDADKLDALGAVGVARCAMTSARRNASIFDGMLAHYDDKLRHLPAMMHTTVGAMIAKFRWSFMETYAAVLKMENKATLAALTDALQNTINEQQDYEE